MRVMFIYLVAAFIAFGGPPVSANANDAIAVAQRTDPTLFFETLQDVPVMPGLTELEDYTLVFDKPEGRIIEMVARIDGASVSDVRDYYRRSLPQLGWVMASQDSYTRGEEHLSLNFESEQNDSFLRMTVQPR
jgi:hypothetical protein